MRRDYHAFRERGAEILAVGPDSQEEFKRYWSEHDIPFVGLPDPEHRVADPYGQQVGLLELGRMPALVATDREGVVRYSHYGGSMRDIPSNERLLEIIDGVGAGSD